MGFLDGLTRRKASVLVPTGVFSFVMLVAGTYWLPSTVQTKIYNEPGSGIQASRLHAPLESSVHTGRKLERSESPWQQTPILGLDQGERQQDSSKDDRTPKTEATLTNEITSENPLLVLNLPNSGEVTINRYFRCAGLEKHELGRFWANTNHEMEMGKCIEANLKVEDNQDKYPLDGCGNFRVWTNIEYVSKSLPRSVEPRHCFFPTLQPETLRKIFKAHPNATIIQALANPVRWYKSLSIDVKKRWPRFCNENHDIKFPEASESEADWVKFYYDHTNMLREIVKEYPSLTYIEVDLTRPQKTADMLQASLGIPATCWLEAAKGNQSRPSSVNTPILVASLPKSATSTTHDYLNCGLGNLQGAHQWTRNETSNVPMQVGRCIEENLRLKRPIFYDCGDNLHYSDIGIVEPSHCFYPTMEGGLDAMYEAYPYGTIMNVVRDGRAWYRSAQKHYNLLGRWSSFCPNFPVQGSTEEEWLDFYQFHTHTVRNFAKRHPTMTYVEIKLESNETANILRETFGFDDSCWGHANRNKEVSSSA
ncbi:expressed unknown protein [Seminavis robusta]|uniref:Uncharacterized protein n=1 Tax=Seminavis robusta TaxID=568900 RepID=A0A9N8DLR9_9STRA|nr:expressed unknown protein [Seminavis robusta]|eukprot:Sro154_g070230.1 n/a (536) ;mRNA; f:95706-97313